MRFGGVSLRDHVLSAVAALDARIMAVLAERDARYSERLHAQEENVRTALTATERRFESVNEFRATLADQAARFATIDQVEALRTTVNILQDRVNKAEGGRQGLSSGWAILVGLVGVVGVVVALLARL